MIGFALSIYILIGYFTYHALRLRCAGCIFYAFGVVLRLAPMLLPVTRPRVFGLRCAGCIFYAFGVVLRLASTLLPVTLHS
jgi:hypothetical protein